MAKIKRAVVKQIWNANFRIDYKGQTYLVMLDRPDPLQPFEGTAQTNQEWENQVPPSFSLRKGIWYFHDEPIPAGQVVPLTLSDMTDIEVQAWMKTPPVKFQAMADQELAKKGGRSNLYELSKSVASDAQRAAFVSEYIFMRSEGQTHEKAVKLANAKLAKVRKAMGFTYHKTGAFNI